MARRKKFRRKTFRKKHKSRRGNKITSNKTRHLRGGEITGLSKSLMNTGMGLMNTAANGAAAAAARTPTGTALTYFADTPQGQALQTRLKEEVQRRVPGSLSSSAQPPNP
jgi:hypothetical protein